MLDHRGSRRDGDGPISLTRSEKSMNTFTYLGGKTAEKCVPEMTKSKCKIFVKKVSKKFTHSII